MVLIQATANHNYVQFLVFCKVCQTISCLNTALFTCHTSMPLQTASHCGFLLCLQVHPECALDFAAHT